MRQGGFFSELVNAERGCTQGDIDSPIIFNVIVDAVLRCWEEGRTYRGSKGCFYADDGLLDTTDPNALQSDLESMLKLFGQVGLQPNAIKTKFMIV